MSVRTAEADATEKIARGSGACVLVKLQSRNEFRYGATPESSSRKCIVCPNGIRFRGGFRD